MAKKKLTKILVGYDESSMSSDKRDKINKGFHAKKISGSVGIKTKRFLDSRPVRIFRKITNLFSYAQAKAYGVLFFTFGLLSLIIGFTRNYIGDSLQIPLSSLIISAVFAVLAIPLMLVDLPLSVMLEKFKPTEVIFFEFFCIKRLYYTGKEAALNPFIAAFIGVALAVLGAFVPIWIVALGILAVVFVALSFLSPEFTFFFTLLGLPYVSLLPYPSLILAFVATVGALSFARKTLFGKRVIFIERYDVLIWFMMIGILLSGIFVKGIDSFINALIICSAFFGYFLASNTVTNRRLADCAVNALALSSIPAVIVSYVQFIITVVRRSPLYFAENGIPSTFNSPRAAAAFFLVAIVFTSVVIKESHHLKKGLSTVLLVLNVIALLATGEVMAVLALLLGILAYLSVKAGKRMLVVIPLLLIAPYSLLFIPEQWILSLPIRVYSQGIHYLMAKSISVFTDNILLGIGMGPECFISEMEKHGVVGFTDSGNIFLELGLEAGVVAITAFLLLLFIRLLHRCSYRKYVTHSQVSKMSPFMSMAVFVLLVFGTFNYLFSDVTVLYLFWCVFGIGSSALRVAKGEHDDRVMYFEDEKSSDSAVANLNLR